MLPPPNNLSLNNTPLLDITELSFQYTKSKETALSQVNLKMESGEILGLLGINGAGKTTLVSLITGLLSPSSGKIHINGLPAKGGREDIAFVPQEYAFYEKLTARENLNYFSGVLNIKNKKPVIAEVLNRCKLDQLANKQSRFYSGGEKRRLNFAIGLLKKSHLLILDEPTANVDPHSRALILEIIREQHQQGTSIIYTSHLLSEVQSLCNTLALLHNGVVHLAGKQKELLAKEQSPMKIVLPDSDQTKFNAVPHWLPIHNSTITVNPAEVNKTPLEILQTLDRLHITPVSLRYGETSLESLFLNITSENSKVTPL